jgi:Uma2 family endonuclease
MSFDDFQRAESVEGYRYELSRGVIEVTDIPGRVHALVVHAINRQFAKYVASHGESIEYFGGGSEAKTEMPAMESERHPDLSIYLTPMPEDEYPWDKWAPSIVVEVVSADAEARRRDYETKREEYLAAGIQEYWIVDPYERIMLALARHGDIWREKRLDASATLTTPLLPGFALNLSAVFAVLDGPGST